MLLVKITKKHIYHWVKQSHFMKLKIFLPILVILILLIPDVNAESVPDWVKNTAGWWASDAISEKEFVNAIEFLVNEGIIDVTASDSSKTSQNTPDWVKNTAGWWASDAISEKEFVNAIEFLVNEGIIDVKSLLTPATYAKLWTDNKINDEQFITKIEPIIKQQKGQSLELPKWLQDNAGFWSAKILTNSDFNFNGNYLNDAIYPCIHLSIDTSCYLKEYNSYGFRYEEIDETKIDTSFRIFAVGGSTTYGSASNNDETWPGHLERIISEITENDVKVINAGISGASSKSEYELIKNKIIPLKPDLIIMYDGWNDANLKGETKTIENWKSVCKLGQEKGFDTIIVIQPIVSTGNRIMTDQEVSNFLANEVKGYNEKSQEYVDSFEELDAYCTMTSDFRGIFDYVQKPIFWDGGHTMSFGNEIIAENILSLISSKYFDIDFTPTYKSTKSDDNFSKNLSGVYAAGANFSNKNFNNLNLQNAIFDKTDLRNTSFTDTQIDGARFTFANLDNSNLFERDNLSGINLAGVKFPENSLKGKNLSGANLSHVDLTKQDLSDTNLQGATLSYVKFPENSLKGKNLSGANLSHVDLTKQDLSDTNLTNAFFLRTDLSNKDFRNINVDGADFRYANLEYSILPNSILIENKFDNSNLSYVDLSGKDLSNTSFIEALFIETDFSNTKLKNARFNGVDFSKIKNNDLSSSDLTGSVFSFSNFKNTEFPNFMQQVNFIGTQFNNVDFVSKKLIGVIFKNADMRGADFRNADMQGVIGLKTFENSLYLLELNPGELRKIFPSLPNISIKNISVEANNVNIEIIYYNNFVGANLKDTNFESSTLWYADFANADMRGADFRNADMRDVYLVGANLEGANLEGANLEGANLNCIGHEICTKK